MIPESELIRNEFVLRKIDFPQSVSLTKKSLLRWCSLSLGLISPKESRDKGFLVFDALFTFLFTKKISPTTLDLMSFIKEKNGVLLSEKLIRYHLNRLIKLGLIIRMGVKYKINSSSVSEDRTSLRDSFDDWTRKEVLAELDKISFALEQLQKSYEE